MSSPEPIPAHELTTSVALSDRAADRHPLGELLVLALPTVAQMASYTVMHFTDTLMLSYLGLVEPTASANASLFGFAITSVGFGTLWVTNTLVSQSYGRGDRERCGQYLWQGIWFGVVYGLLMLPILPLAEPLFAAFGHEPRLAHLEATYLWITLSFTAFRLAAATMGQFLLAIVRHTSSWREICSSAKQSNACRCRTATPSASTRRRSMTSRDLSRTSASAAPS